MTQINVLVAAVTALALLGGSAVAHTAPPDQGAAPSGSNPNMEDGAGAGPAGSIGDPNGTGPGAAAPPPGSGPTLVPQTAGPGRALPKTDATVLKSCLAMPREAMNRSAKCRALMARRRDLFK